MEDDRPDYVVDVSQFQRGGRNVSLRTYADISPEVVLMDKIRLHVESLRAGVDFDDVSISATWRKRLANVLQR